MRQFYKLLIFDTNSWAFDLWEWARSKETGGGCQQEASATVRFCDEFVVPAPMHALTVLWRLNA
ncbi:hypothetical protein Mag101_00900 [Microbulbifer agarilyticus]|uniref:Uncharacterized protein n=1 Tax=Microbulbifer agarilyticus TaxID=260552 RepID=A0A1Q2M0X9_9GAMM|nr:hypothetical protein Mag101_00900 [Microbulbifer agarilyticus]